MFVKSEDMCRESFFCASEFDEVGRIFILVNPRVSTWELLNSISIYSEVSNNGAATPIYLGFFSKTFIK